MNFDYCLETSFVSARRNSALSLALAASNPRLMSEFVVPQPTLDLNDITREYEKHKRKLLDERMVNLREMLLSPRTDAGSFLEALSDLAMLLVMSEVLTPTTLELTPVLPLASKRTLDEYERMVAETRSL